VIALLAVPLAAEAQPAGRIPRIGFLGPGPMTDWSDTRETFRDGLRALGYIEGKTFASSGDSRPAGTIDCPIWPASWFSSIPT
jgi:hypothetical protein